ncbi:MAG TPA: GGDEF domain-containing protein [Acidimicrobiales bacterium]
MDPSSHPSFFATVIERSVYVWVVIDAGMVLTYVSPAAEQLFGYTPEALVGTSAIDLLEPEYQDQAMNTLAELLTNPGEGVPVVMGVRHADGSTVHVEVGAVVHLDDPHIQGIVVRLRPYDDQHLLEKYLEALAASVPVEQTLQPLVESIKAQHLESEVSLAYDWDGEHFATAIHTGLPPALNGTASEPDLDLLTPPWVQAIRTGNPASTAVLDELDPSLESSARQLGVVACWAYPVPVPPDRALLACLIVWRRIPGGPLLGHGAALGRSVQLAALGFERRHNEELLLYAARHDTLTGIPNRSHFYDELEALRGSPASGATLGPAVLFADLDGFKAVNDTRGHGVGDAVLVVVARRLQSAIRPGDVLARVGGDEFAVLCVDLSDRADALAVADRLIEAVRRPIQVDGVSVVVGLSIGVAFRAPGAAAGQGLVDEADRALYRAKEAGKGCWKVAGTA